MNQLAFPVTPANTHMTYGASIHDPPAIGNGTYTSWPGGVDPSVPLYAGNPVPLSMGTTQSGGRRNRKASRKNRKASRKNRKASRKNNSRKNNSRKNNSRKNNSRKNGRKNNRH